MRIRGMCLVSAVLVAAGALSAEAGDTIPLRVVTLNVKEGINLNTSAYFATGDFLTTNDVDGAGPNMGLNPDVVALQECRSTTHLEAYRDTYLPGYQFFRGFVIDAGGNFNAYFVRGDITVLDLDELNVGGPRRVIRITCEVPGAEKLVTFYNCHLKAFGDSASQQTRTNQANDLGQDVYNDINFDLDLDDNASRETPVGHSIVLGDLNSPNNSDSTIDGIFTHSNLSVPTGLENLPVEALAGQPLGGAPLIATRSGSRLDYICLDSELALMFDGDSSGSYPLPPNLPNTTDQDEVNAMGFVYYSGDDFGMMSNGDSTSTSTASDHRPVVFDLLLPAAAPACPGDENGDNIVDFTDLNAVLGNFGNAGAPGIPGDVNEDGVVDFTDLNEVLGNFGTSC